MWRCYRRCYRPGTRACLGTFKAKGRLHCVSEVRGLLDRRNVEALAEETAKAGADAKEFASAAVRPARLEQGFDHLREHGLCVVAANLGKYVQWVAADVAREEAAAIAELGLNARLVRKAVSTIARDAYLHAVTERSRSDQSSQRRTSEEGHRGDADRCPRVELDWTDVKDEDRARVRALLQTYPELCKCVTDSAMNTLKTVPSPSLYSESRNQHA